LVTKKNRPPVSEKDATTLKAKQDYIGTTAYIVLLLIKTKISDLNFNMQIFVSAGSKNLHIKISDQ